MIEKIEILQHSEGRYLGSHPREEAPGHSELNLLKR